MKTNSLPKIKAFFAISIFAIYLTSCRFADPYPIDRSNNVVEEVIPVQNFDRVEIGNSFKVFIKKGANFSVSAKGDQNDIINLEAIVNNGKLKIRYKTYTGRRYEMALFITMPNLTEADFSGSTIVEIINFNENKLKLYGSGNSDIYVDSDAKIWDVAISGNAVIEMKGLGRTMYLDASGATDVFANNLYVDNIDLDISGTSQANVFAYDKIIGRASGASEVRFRGNPLVDIKLSGTSWVSRN
jgi:hypothetical protein